MFDLSGVSPCHISRPRSNGERNGKDRVLHTAGRRALGFHPLSAGRRDLSGCKAINLIVHDDVRQIDVAPHAVHEMVAADAVAVAVASGNNDLEIVIGKLGSRGYSEGASMQGVHAVGTKIPRKVGRTADAADGHYLMWLQIQLC